MWERLFGRSASATNKMRTISLVRNTGKTGRLTPPARLHFLIHPRIPSPLPRGDLPAAVRTVAQMGAGHGGDTDLSRAVGPLAAPDALDPVGEVQRLDTSRPQGMAPICPHMLSRP